jgi:hypothetical protein
MILEISKSAPDGVDALAREREAASEMDVEISVSKPDSDIFPPTLLSDY